MSELQVQVATITKIEPHKNADRLELAQVLGWQTVVPKGQYTVGQTIVYFPPDTMLPEKTSDKFGVTEYLHKGRIKAIKLRGEPSFGLIMTPDNPQWEVGRDVAAHYGATKYEPPQPTFNQRRVGQGRGRQVEYLDSLPEHPLFPKNTAPEHLRNFPTLIEDRTPVILTEKLHGTSSRIGIINGQWMIGSHKVRRVLPLLGWKERLYTFLKGMTKHSLWYKIARPLFVAYVLFLKRNPVTNPYAFDTFTWTKAREDDMLYWYPLSIPEVRTMLIELAKAHTQVMLYGEIYGKGVQWMEYGREGLDYVAFDLYIDGKFLGWDGYRAYCTAYGIPMAPLIADIPYDLDVVREYASGKTTLMKDKAHLREGVVLRPKVEQSHPRIGRVLFKYVNDEYLIKNADKDQRDV